MKNNQLTIIGVMSGTSLDGLDLALCSFWKEEDKYGYSIEIAQTISYSQEMKQLLRQSMTMSGVELTKLDRNYGKFIGESILAFIQTHQISKDKVNFVSSHGHTVFHSPKEGYTLQIGHGGSISAACSIPTICDFRSTDVALGGQGAPLVPIGDEQLFENFSYCLNIGGIINISYQQKGENNLKRIAFDVSPANIILNALTQQYFEEEYDKDGIHAYSGICDQQLLESLESIEFFHKNGPKSLGKENIDKEFFPIIQQSSANGSDKLATVIELMAKQTAKVIQIAKQQHSAQPNIKAVEASQSSSSFVEEGLDEKDSKQQQSGKDTIFATGGGAYNKQFIARLEYQLQLLQLNTQVVIPSSLIIEFKEALIFAFLGYLRAIQLPNCLKSVTGATIDNIGGCIYL